MRGWPVRLSLVAMLTAFMVACGAGLPTATPVPVLYDSDGTPIAYPTPTPQPTPTATATATPAGPTPTPHFIDRGDGTLMKQYGQPPQMTIDPTHQYKATFKTGSGDIVVELYADKAPRTVNNFVFLARDGYYDDTTFHRVLDGFMAQAGDPTGTGRGGPGYQFADEFDPTLKHDKPGTLSMANAGPNTNGSQFFLTFVPTPHLDNRHAVFGRVVEGMDVLLNLKRRDPNQNPSFEGEALQTIEITETE